MGDIDYKELWFELCEEKKQLQMENHRLKKEYEKKIKELEEQEWIKNIKIDLL